MNRDAVANGTRQNNDILATRTCELSDNTNAFRTLTKNQFTIRGVLVLMILVALSAGWYVSQKRQEQLKQRNLRHNSRYSAALSRIRTLESRLQRSESPRKPKKNVAAGLLSQANIDGISFKDSTLTGGDFAFRELSIRGGDLTNATLQGGDSSFQRAMFDETVATGARLSGGSGAFVEATFENADLTATILTGTGTSFQASSFKNAKLVSAKFVVTSTVAFEAVNIDGAHFQGADLSSVSASALRSCFFDSPPKYNQSTQFPNGFDPKVEGI